MKKIFTFCVSLLAALSVFAYDFQSGDLFYNITSSSAPYTVEVTYQEPWSLSLSNYSGLTTATIPEIVTYDGTTYSVTSIGDYAFYYCSSLTSITIPYSVTSIGGNAFTLCSSLTSITIPNSVTSIGYGAFSYCSSLTSITIPNSVTSIGSAAFILCFSLTSMMVEAGNTTYDSRENCNAIIETATNTLIAGCQNTIIPYSVTSIGDYAFFGCSSLASITIPNSVTSIGNLAFCDCSSLTSMVVESGNTTYDSRENCNAIIETATNTLIAGCQNTIIPNSVTSIGECAFYYCSSLTTITIPNSVTSIGDDAFAYCKALTSITIPYSVTSIGGSAFADCSYLTSIIIPNGVKSIGDYAFEYCSSLTSITIPNSLASIGQGAFKNCSVLDTIHLEATTPPALGSGVFTDSPVSTCIIPCGTKAAYEASDWAQYISEFVEEDCVDPTWQITYTSSNDRIVTPYATDVFGANIVSNTYENGVGTITFDGPVTSIGDYAFEYCSSLTSITIPNSVTSIGNSAFSGCSCLTSITIPKNVTSISPAAFWGCPNLASINVDNNNLTYDSRGNCNAIIETAINTLLVGCQNTTIPNTIVTIGEDAFRDCKHLTSIVIPNSVKTISGWAFFECTSLTSITIPESVINIGKLVFCGCSSLATIHVDSNNAKYDSRNNCNAIVETATNTLVAGCKNTVIPNDIEVLGLMCFTGCDSLRTISIPESVNTIGNFAFYRCYILDSIHIGSNVTTIGDSAFYECFQLSSIVIPNSVHTIGEKAFRDCTSLNKVILGDNVTTIGDEAFRACATLGSIIIPKTVVNIGLWTFAGCSSLDTIHVEATTPPTLSGWGGGTFYSTPLFTCYIPCGTLAAYQASDWAQYVSEFIEEGCIDPTWQITYTSTDGNIVTPHDTTGFGANIVSNTYENGVGTITFDGPVTSIGYRAFRDCFSLISITIPNSVTGIGEWAFDGCDKLTSITIPNSVTSIGEWAFHGCDKLTSITIPNSVTSIGEMAFASCDKLTSIVVESGNIIYDSRENCDAIIETATNTLIAGCKKTIIPNSVTSIGEGAFCWCTSLSTITIPNSVTSIGGRAFEGCSSLSTITIPNCVMSIGYWAFNGCPSLDTIHLEATTPPALGYNKVFTSSPICVIPCGTLAEYEISEWKNYVEAFVFDDTCEDKWCGDNLYWKYRNGVLTLIGTGDMYDYASDIDVPWYDVYDKITSINIPNGVSKIGNNAFASCISLDEIYVEAAMPPALGDNALPSSSICLTPCGTLAVYEASDWANQVGSFEEFCPAVVKAKVPASWEDDDITVWVWTDGAGTEYPTTKDGDWYVYTHSVAEEFNIIFKSGTGWQGDTYQTVDINGIKKNTCLQIQSTSGKATYSIVDCPSIIYKEPTDALNPFAYALSSELSQDKSQLLVNYSLNARATDVQIVIMDGETAVKTIVCDGLSKGSHSIAIPTAGLPEYKQLTWKVEVKGAVVTEPTEYVVNYSFYRPSAVDIDNNPENPTFGMILTNEGMHKVKDIEGYLSTGYGAGIYAFNPAFEPMPNGDKPGYNGGIEFTNSRADNADANAYSPYRIRISEDGRIFVTSLNTDGNYLWEVNPENMNEWNSIFKGTLNGDKELVDAGGNFIAAPNTGFDVKGSGENLQLAMYSVNLLGITVAAMSGFRLHEYNLGTATEWTTAPSKNWVNGKYAIHYTGTQVEYDNEGGIWIASYRGTASAANPGLVHINAEGVEDCKLLWSNVRQAGIRFNNDFTKLVVAGNNGSANKATIYAVSKDANGAPVLTEEWVIDATYILGKNLNDFAFDYAGNLYACGNSTKNGEKLVAWAMPRSADDIVTTPAASKYSFVISDGNNIITYTSTDGNIVTPYATDVFGANIVSNVYENGMGTITFDGPVTKIGDLAFQTRMSLKSITLPNTVTSIGKKAFHKCHNLKSITIPNSVISIESRAFDHNTSLTSIVIPSSVTNIGDYAFNRCTSLSSIFISNSVTNIGYRTFAGCYGLISMIVENGNIVYDSRENCNAIIETATNTLIFGCQNTIIPESVMSIGDYAFDHCCDLTSISIPSNVLSIGDYAFVNCHSLSSVFISNSVTNIGYMAFASCFDLASILVDSENTTYDSRDNCNAIIETATNTLIAGCQNTVIPNSVTSIGERAFYDCRNLSSITIPNSITSIGSRAFGGSYSLDTIYVKATTPPALEDTTVFNDTTYTYTSPVCVIPCGTLAAYEASDWANYMGEFVEDCVEGQQIYYTSTDGNIVTPNATDVFGANIVSNTYENGQGVITFDGPVTSIGDRAFFGCSGLTSITISNSVTSIGEGAFSTCSGLTSIVVDGENTTYDSRENCNAIIETATNTLITGCQNTIIPNSVTSIGNNAFYYCFSLTSITIPNSVTSIGESAFFGCDGLTSITIPNSVTSIEYYAFSSCDGLTSITIPNSVTSIGESAFSYCSSLTSIVVDVENTTYDSRENCNAIIETATNTLITGCQNTIIPNSVMSIGEYAFYGCDGLTSVTIPNSVTSIGERAFLHCSSLDTIHIEAITPPTLGTNAFTSSPTCYIPCGTLSAYQASDWAQYVSEFVEEGCAPIQMCGDDLYWEYADGVLTITGTGDMYDYTADTDVPWYDVRGNIKTVSLPDAMTKIGQNAFYKCTNMTTINMPTSLTAIGEKAFAQDTKLACEIILPASMTNIATRAFFNCQAVTAFHIEATTPPTIPNDAFERTTAPIHVPCGYGHIYGKHTQWGMLNLEMCELLQDNVYYYPIDGHTARAVTYHSNPTDTLVIPSAVVIDGMPRTVTEVAASAFADCKDIPAIIFNEGLEYIGERAFVRCYGLQGTIVLPATLETIGERAFSYCNNVEKYLIQAMTPPALGANAFTGDNKNALFYISCEVMDDYKVATNWSSLKSRLRDACLNIYHYNTALGANGVYTTEDTLVASIYYRRKFTPYRWETLYLPFEVDRVTVLENGLEYDLTAWDIVDGGHYFLAKPDGMLNKEILFGFTDELESHTPYIIQFSDAYYTDKLITFYGKESWNKLSTSFEVLSSSAWMQIAGNTTMQDQLLEKPVYMLRSGLDFILQKTTTTLHPFECYVMPYTTQSGAPARMGVRMRDDVATAVESVKGNESHLTYTVDGYTLTVYPQGQAFSIYSLNGALIYSCEAGKEAVDCELNSGCYLLHAGTEAHKIML